MKAYTLTLAEQKNKNKGLKISLFLHIAIIAIAIFPFLMNEEPPKNELQMIFLDFSSGSSNEGAKEEVKLDEQVASSSVEEVKEPKEEPKVEESKPILTAKNEEVIIESTEEEQIEIIEDIPVEVQEEAVEETIEEVVEVVEKPADTEILTESEVTDKGGSGAMGEGEKGDGKNDKGNAKNGQGKGFIEGDGVLQRKVIHYANLKDIIKTNGKLVMKICINRHGIVTYIEYDEENSTIKDKMLAKKAIDVVAKYRFEKDYSAAYKECGRLTYFFKVD